MTSEIFERTERKCSNFFSGHYRGKINPNLEKDSKRSFVVQDSHREKFQYQECVNL